MRLLAPLGLLALAALAAGGLPTPAEAILVASGAGAGGLALPVALVAAWAGYSFGDVASFAALRGGVYHRLPARWRKRIEASRIRQIGAGTVFASRLLPGSAVVNALAAAGTISMRRFAAAAIAGEAVFAAGVLAVGLGGGELLRRSLPLALALVVAVGVVLVARRVRGQTPLVDPAQGV
jgi:membrane protein DedA with SNARE-associated domain